MTQSTRKKLLFAAVIPYTLAFALLARTLGWSESTFKLVTVGVALGLAFVYMPWVMLEPDERRDLTSEIRRRLRRSR
jgi:uncharacterized membrane protein